MKKILLSLMGVLVLATINYSQSNQFGTLNLSAGAGFGAYATNSEITATYFNGSFTYTDKDTSGAVTTYFYLSGDFGVVKFLSVGAYFQTGKYLQEPEDGVVKDNGFYKLGIMPKLYLINNDKFNLYTGLGLGIQGLTTSEDDGTTKSEGKYAGTNLHIRLGMNLYFTESIGMFMHAGYDGNNMDLKELSFTNGSTTNTPSNLSGNLIAKGLEMAVGLNFKFSAGK